MFLFLINLFRRRTFAHIPSLQNGLRVIHYFPSTYGNPPNLTFLRSNNSFREKKREKEEKERKKKRNNHTRPPCSPPPSPARGRSFVSRRHAEATRTGDRTMETVKQKDGFVVRRNGVLCTLCPLMRACVTNTQAMIIEPRFEGETIIIMIILKLEGRRPPANKLRVCLAACAPHSGIGAFDRSVSDQFCFSIESATAAAGFRNFLSELIQPR